MKVHAITPVLNVASIPNAIAWFEKLGWQRGFTWNAGGDIKDAADSNEHGEANFGSVCVDDVSIFLCRNAQGSRGTIVPKFPGDDETDGVWMTWWMGTPAEVDEMHSAAVQNGLIVTMPPTDEPWGIRECHLRSPDGHMFRVSSGLGED